MLLCAMYIINAQDINYLKFRADSFYNIGKFKESIVDCERILYLSPNLELTIATMQLEAKAFQQLGQYQIANNILLSIPIIGFDSTKFVQWYYNLALNSFLIGNFEESKSFLSERKKYGGKTSDNIENELLTILVFSELMQWDSIKPIVIQSPYLQVWQKDSILTLLECKPKILNRSKLEWYNRFIPGSGHIIAGHFWEGLTSFILCASALTFGIYEIYNGYYITGYFLGAGFLNSFYSGGLRRIQLITDYENNNRKLKYNNQLKRWLK